MDDPILTGLKAAQNQAWERVRELAGLMAWQWLQIDEEAPDPTAQAKLEALQTQACALLQTLKPESRWTCYSVYNPRSPQSGIVKVELAVDDACLSFVHCITAPMPPAPEQEPSAIDLLQALGE